METRGLRYSWQLFTAYTAAKFMNSEKSVEEFVGIKQDNMILEYAGFKAH
jgi:hypothetical protein